MKRLSLGNRLILLLGVAASLLAPQRSSFAASPKITITSVSAYGNGNGVVNGIVSGIANPAGYYAVVYIQVSEVWWIKPTVLDSKCLINADGTFTCKITTSSTNCDLYATAVFVQLMPKNTNPVPCNPCQVRPKNADAQASAVRYRPYPRAISFSGYRWRVRQTPRCRFGPGNNYFSGTSNDVFVDATGRLHLRIRNVSGKWYSSEVVLTKSLGYGKYVFRTASRVDNLDPNTVVGMFTWDSKVYTKTHREMDVELSRWGNSSDSNNSQFAVQPCGVCPGCGDNCSRFRIQLSDQAKYVTYYMIWSPGKVEFSAYRGRGGCLLPATAKPIHSWTKTTGVPTPRMENIHLNFWLMNGLAPLNASNAEVVFEKFLFCPPPP